MRLNWNKTETLGGRRWVAISDTMDFTIIEKTAPFGAYYKMGVILRYVDGSHATLMSVGQRTKISDWMLTADEMVASNNPVQYAARFKRI